MMQKSGRGDWMYQPGKWVWGVVPLGLLWFSANQFFEVQAIDNDLRQGCAQGLNRRDLLEWSVDAQGLQGAGTGVHP